jgi:hypothetical protein
MKKVKIFNLLFPAILFLTTSIIIGQEFTYETPEISAGAEAAFYLQKAINSGNVENYIFRENENMKSDGGNIITSITPIYGVDFDTDAATSGFYHIPPDPCGAAGLSHLVAVNNTCIRWTNKAGGSVSLKRLGKNASSIVGSFFQSLSPVNQLFDPKVIYDQYFDRFVVVALERQDIAAGDPVNASRILVAVSSTSDPNQPWYFTQINSNITIGGSATWADYPGFAVNDDAVLITTNQYTYGSSGTYKGSRLWLIEKGVGLSGFYDGGTPTVYAYDPATSSGTSPLTIQPSHTFGPLPPVTRAYLVGYSGLTSGGNEFISVIELAGTYGAPTFTNTYVSIGNVDNTGIPMPDAPQNGTTHLIDTGDRRALHAVWRNNLLYNTMTLVPPSGPDNGQATAHWVICSAAGGPITYADQGDCGAEYVAVGTFTFYPSIAVNVADEMVVGFAASGSSIYCGAYYAGKIPSDPPGTTPYNGVLQSGLDYYNRTFGGGRNRWGDYSSISVDPINDLTFWLFNEYAMMRGTIISGEDGRWATAFGKIVDPPFPVELTSFAGKFVDGNVLLTWSTATETNNKGFQVERKKEKTENKWEELGFVEGNGSVNVPKSYSFTDKNLSGSGKIFYRLKQIDFDGTYDYSNIIEVEIPLPLAFELGQNYPNPISKSSTQNSGTRIEFTLPARSNVKLAVYNSLGEKVAELINGEREGGYHSYQWNTTNIPSGIYFYRLTAGQFSQTKKMVILR